jgi:hypothetical protein
MGVLSREGMGPSGELRFSGFRANWNYCGIGEFQNYDKVRTLECIIV